MPVDAVIPVIGMVSRLVEQKGLEIILQAMDELLSHNLQLIILGTGELHYEIQLTDIAQQYPEKLKVIIGYNESLAHRIEAASDIYLMPSTFEPCGLNQLYSLCYGCLPLVTPVGGLADTVNHASKENINNGTANGFVLKKHSKESLLDTIEEAIKLYQQPDLWRKLQLNAMNNDFSWQKSARHYIELYQQLLDINP